MARSNTGDTANRLEANAAPISAVPFGMCAWVYPANTTSFSYLLSPCNTGSSNNYFSAGFDGAGFLSANDRFYAMATGSGPERAALASANYAANTWQLLTAGFYSATSRAVGMNGANVGTNATSATPTGVNDFQVGVVTTSGGIFGALNGRVAHVALWDLTGWGADAAARRTAFESIWPALALGVRPDWFTTGLTAYYPLDGIDSPEPDYAIKNGDTRFPLTMTGAMAAATGPGVENYSRRWWRAGGGYVPSDGPITYTRTVTDNLAAGDATSRQVSSLRQVSNNLGVGDTTLRQVNSFRQVADSLGVADTALRRGTSNRVTTDALGIADAALKVTVFGRVATDSVAMSDATLTVSALFRSVTDSVALGDSVLRSAQTFRQVANDLGVSDSVLRSGTVTRQVADSLALTDAVQRAGTSSRQATDGMGILDATLTSSAYRRIVADLLAIGDEANVLNVTPGLLLIVVADALGVGDTLLRTATGNRQATDSIAVADAASRVVVSSRQATDSIGATDAALVRTIYARAVLDSLGVQDAIMRQALTNLAVADSVALQDTLLRQATYARQVVDLVAIADAVLAIIAPTGGGLILGTFSCEPAVLADFSTEPTVLGTFDAVPAVLGTFSVEGLPVAAPVHFIGSDVIENLTGLRDYQGNYLNAATVTYQLKSPDGTVIGSGSYDYTTASNGDYTTTIESSVTELERFGKTYTMEVTIVSGGFDDFRVLPRPAQYRGAQ